MTNEQMKTVLDVTTGRKWFVTEKVKNAVYQLLRDHDYYRVSYREANGTLNNLENTIKAKNAEILDMEQRIKTLEGERNDLGVQKKRFYDQLERQNEAIKSLAGIAGV